MSAAYVRSLPGQLKAHCAPSGSTCGQADQLKATLYIVQRQFSALYLELTIVDIKRLTDHARFEAEFQRRPVFDALLASIHSRLVIVRR